MLDQREAAPIVGSTVRTLQRMRSEQYGPPYYRVGGRCLYSRRELLIWLAAQRVPQPSEPGADHLARAAEHADAAADYGNGALDLVEKDSDRVRSAAEMGFAQLEATLALVEAVRGLGAKLDGIEGRLAQLDGTIADLGHAVRFSQDPPQPHSHALHLS